MLNYPLALSFKLLALSPQIRVADASGQPVLYVRQKALTLKEDIRIFADESQQRQLFQIRADNVLDFAAQFNITAIGGGPMGAVKRQGLRSLWRALYEIRDPLGAPVGVLREVNPWAKLLDALLGEVPFLNMLINPAYQVDLRGEPALVLQKKPALFERQFTVEKLGDFSEADEKLLLASILMAVLLERSRG